MTAGNAGPMTFTEPGLSSAGEVAVIDPGPTSEIIPPRCSGLARRDHHNNLSPTRRMFRGAGVKAADELAQIVGCAPHDFSRQLSGHPIDAAHDSTYAPDAILREGEAIEAANFSLACVETPGHAKNHQAFALPQETLCFRAIM
jgi:hypothetical protein